MPDEHMDELMRAFALESRLAARGEVLAAAAKADGEERIAQALRAQAASRQVRARRLLRLARGKIARGRDAVLGAVRDDQAKAADLYQSLSPDSVGSLMHGAKVERLMPGMLERAAEGDGAAQPEGFAVCQVCGFVKQGASPQRCPVCGALRNKFETVY